MRHPWVNIALLALVLLLIASGSLGLVSGSPKLAWALWLHGIAAYAVLAVLFWKGAVVLHALRRRRRPSAKRTAFLVLALLLLATLATGLVWSFSGRRLVYGYSLITIHIALAVSVLALMLWHAFAMRFIFRVPPARDRRAFLRLAAAGIGGVALWRLSAATQGLLDLPGAGRRFTGSYEVGSMAGAFPTVSWLFDAPPPEDIEKWRLTVDGAVERPLALAYQDLAGMAEDTLLATIDCTGGWYSKQEWRGVLLGRLLDQAGVKVGARSVTVESVTGYNRRFRLDQARGYLLATHVAGQPLSHGHGAPARLAAPGHRGYDWVKWVTHIHVNETSWLWQPPVPLQ